MIIFNRKLCLSIRIYHTAWLVATSLLLYCMITAINNLGETELVDLVIDKQEEILLPGKFNLVEDAVVFNGALMRPPKECTLEYMNFHRLPQDHPCVINYLRHHVLKKPASPHLPLNLDYPEVSDPSMGQPEEIIKILRLQGVSDKEGFFIECGALDGENLSNTLYLERSLNWTGILIEADQDSFSNLMTKNRKSWAAPVCLSTKPYPTQVTFVEQYGQGKILEDKDVNPHILPPGWTSSDGKMNKIQCFPFYSILLAVNRTTVDYFSLDIEGDELAVLKTIPMHKINIRTLTVEYASFKDNGKDEIKKYMEDQGYASLNFQHDFIFARRKRSEKMGKY